MRTDRHNNPTAMTTDVAKTAGLVEGKDYVKGDPFKSGNSTLYTAKLIGNPVEKTIKAIDRMGFYTSSGNPRWSHTAIPKTAWDNMSHDQKKKVVARMYKNEGNKGTLNKYF